MRLLHRIIPITMQAAEVARKRASASDEKTMTDYIIAVTIKSQLKVIPAVVATLH